MTALRRSIVFLGSKRLGCAVLHSLVERLSRDHHIIAINFDDSGDTRSCFDELKSLGSKAHKYFEVCNRKEAEKVLWGSGADLTIVCGWYFLIGAETLRKLNGPVLGLHGSLLPRFRGFAPTVWSMIKGEKQIGYTIFEIVEELDAGDTYYSFSMENYPDLTIKDVLGAFEVDVAENLGRVCAEILAGRIQPTPQDHGQASYCAKRIPSDGEIDWRLPAREVHDFIRAQTTPYPGAYTWLRGEKLVIEKSSLLDRSYVATPGQVVSLLDQGVVVSCGNDTVISIESVRSNGATDIVPANQYLKSFDIRLAAGHRKVE